MRYWGTGQSSENMPTSLLVKQKTFVSAFENVCATVNWDDTQNGTINQTDHCDFLLY